jgi:hypothetical protein
MFAGREVGGRAEGALHDCAHAASFFKRLEPEPAPGAQHAEQLEEANVGELAGGESQEYGRSPMKRFDRDGQEGH